MDMQMEASMAGRTVRRMVEESAEQRVVQMDKRKDWVMEAHLNLWLVSTTDLMSVVKKVIV